MTMWLRYMALALTPYGTELLAGEVEADSAPPIAIGRREVPPPSQAPAYKTPQFTLLRSSPISTEIAHDGSGMSVSLSSVSGTGVLMQGETFLGGLLTSRNSWRRRVAIGLAPTGLADIGLAIRVVVTDDRKPWQFGDPMSHGVTGVGRWQQNQTSALTGQFALLDSKLRYAGGISSSRFGEVSASASLTPDNPLYRKPMASRGTMHWHRVDARLWDGSKGKALAWFSYADVGQGYRNMQLTADMPFALDGRTVEFGGNFSSGRTKVSLMNRQGDSVYGGSGLTKGSLALGPLHLSISREGWASGAFFGDDGWQSRITRSRAAARIALRDIVRSSGLAEILPDAISLKVSRSHRERGRLGNHSLVDSQRLGVEVERTHGNTATRIGFAKGFTRQTMPGSNAVSGIDETWFDFSHSIVNEGWDLSAYGSMNLRKSAGRTERFYSGGVSLSLAGDNRPKLSIGIDADYFAMRGEIAALDMANQGVNFSASADFSYLIARHGLPGNRTLKVQAFTDWSRTEYYGGTARGEMVPTVLATFAARF